MNGRGEHVFQVITLALSILTGVWYLSTNQQKLVDQNATLIEQNTKLVRIVEDQQKEIGEMKVAQTRLEERMDSQAAKLDAIARKIGMPSEKWQSWRN